MTEPCTACSAVASGTAAGALPTVSANDALKGISSD